MMFLRNLLGTLAFRGWAIRAMAEERAVLRAVVCFAVGLMPYIFIRKVVETYALNAVFASLREAGPVEISIAGLFITLVQAILFFMLVYVPGVIILGNAISGLGLELFIPKEQYQAHVSALLPLWGVVFLVSSPFQWYVLAQPFNVGVGQLALVILMTAFSIWAIHELNYLSLAAAVGVFVLSWLTLPIFYLLTTFLFALPLFVLIPVLYIAFQRMRHFVDARAGERDLQHHLHSLTLNPQDADAHHQLGLIHLKRRNLDAAKRCFTAALKVDPKDPDYHYYLGRAYELAGEWPEALECYEDTYQLNPEYGLGDIFREVGKGYLQTGKVEKAIEFLRFFLENRSSDPEGRYWLAVALQKTGDLDQMKTELNSLLERAKTNPKFFSRGNREWLYRARVLLGRH